MTAPSLLAVAVLALVVAPVQPVTDDVGPVERVVDDYVGLYTRETLERWRELFLPTFTATSTRADGGVSTRTLDEFVEAQRQGFAKARDMSERLENVRIERRGRLASAWADFVFKSDESERRGRLVLLLVEERGRFRIQTLLFSYP